MIVGALNWGILALTGHQRRRRDLRHRHLTDVIYVLVGLTGLMFVPRLVEDVHIGHGPHPRGV